MAGNVDEVVSKMNEQDVYSIICSFMYEIKKIPQYTALSELCYMMDVESFLKLITYFGGRTIKIPTKEEFSEVIQMLLLFHYYKVENRPWKDSLALANIPSNRGKGALNRLQALEETFEKYNIGNRKY